MSAEAGPFPLRYLRHSIMRSSFAARRKARVVGQDAPDQRGGDAPPTGDSSDEQGKPTHPIPASNISNAAPPSSPLIILAEITPVVKRPVIPSRTASKKSSLRLSFNPGETPTTSPDDNNNPSEVFTHKNSNLSRRAIEKNALRKALAPPPTSHLPIRPPDDRPSYSASALSELRNSTPSTPKDLHSLSDTDTEPSHAIDIASKFGLDLLTQLPASIPTEAEIREKKERRARLAKEQDYISLSPSSSTTTTISLLPTKKKPESRLAHDDSDLLETSSSFIDDGTIPLSKHAERDQRRRHAIEMRSLIHDAEQASDSDSDDSEKARHAAYEASQTRFGMDGLPKSEPQRSRPKTPPRITPLPHLAACLERLQMTLRRMEESRVVKVKQAEAVEREKVEIAAREVEIRRLLEEAGETYERLRVEAGAG